MKFWPSHRGGPSGSQPRQDSPHPDEMPPDEHTRLLPNRLDSTPYLSPDDPAVSPYNLWTVRFVRAATVILACIAFIWWVLMVVSAFITPPGLHVRGSPFFAFSYASVAFLLLLISLLFFSVPSRSARLLSVITTVLLLVNVILIAAAPRLRHDEIWVGLASVIWASLMAIWFLMVDWIVQWGKAEEEERLTGRPESRRSVLEWTGVLLETIAMSIVALGALLMTCTLTIRALDSRLTPPGERYWVDGGRYQIHLYCYGNQTDTDGNRTTTVLFEGGEDPVERGLWQFAENAVKNGSISRFCFADRPGMAWSDAAPSPFSASVASDVLSEALSRAGEKGPWVLASAGIGSLYSRVFSSRHGHDVRGILMVDPLHEDLLSRVGSPGRSILLWIQGVISPYGIKRISGALFRGRRAADRVWGCSSYQSEKAIFAKLQEGLVADSLTRRDVVSSRAIQDRNTRLVIISSGLKIRRDDKWEDKQRDLTHLTMNLESWDIIDEAPHRVWDTLRGREMMEKRLKKLVR
ncbi:hypothetical protein VTK26DRAFT_9241 [Humicola hyalothermophila]